MSEFDSVVIWSDAKSLADQFAVVFRLETELEKAQKTALSLEERMRQAERERIEMEAAQRRAEEARRQAEAAAHLEKAEREAKVRDITIIRISPGSCFLETLGGLTTWF